MPRSPLYRANSLVLDYDEVSKKYVLRRNLELNNGSKGRSSVGSSYKTTRQAITLIENLRRSIEEDSRFECVSFRVSEKAEKQLELEERVEKR